MLVYDSIPILIISQILKSSSEFMNAFNQNLAIIKEMNDRNSVTSTIHTG